MSIWNEDPTIAPLIADRFAAEDAARAKWLDEQIRAAKPDVEREHICARGHAQTFRSDGRWRCPVCNRLRMRAKRAREVA